jgi:hypothetical protein
VASLFLQEVIATGSRTQKGEHRQYTANYFAIEIFHIRFVLMLLPND